MSRNRRRAPESDRLNQMALEDGASEVLQGEVPYLQPLNNDTDSDLLFALPGEDSGALAEWDETSLPEYIEPH